jgi:Lon protease-like protein
VGDGLKPLPLFPLSSVLFPNVLVALHVFEDRYKTMISRCVDDGSMFGVVLIREGEEVGDEDVEPYLVGTAASVQDVVRLPDGSMDIVALGSERFRVRELDRSRQYLVGRVEKVEDESWEGTEEDRLLLDQARHKFTELTQVLMDRLGLHVEVRLSADPTAVSFAMAGMLGVRQHARQHLLEVTSATERFAAMLPLMDSLIEGLKGHVLRRSHYSEIRHWLQPN